MVIDPSSKVLVGIQAVRDIVSVQFLYGVFRANSIILGV